MKIAREYFGLNMREWAAIIRGSHSQISLWESGKNSIPYTVAAAYEGKKGVRADWLIDGAGEMLLTKAEHMPDDLKELADLWPKLSEGDRQYILGAAEGRVAAKRESAK